MYNILLCTIFYYVQYLEFRNNIWLTYYDSIPVFFSYNELNGKYIYIGKYFRFFRKNKH